MIVLLHEDPNNIILSELKVFTDKYSIKETGYLGSDFKDEDLARFKYKPLLSYGWLIIVGTKLDKLRLNKLNNLGPQNIILIHATTTTEREEIQSLLDTEKFEYQFIDNHKLNKNSVISYIASTLEITTHLAGRIYAGCGGYIKDIITAIELLGNSKPVTVKKVDSYVGSTNRLPIFAITSYLLGTDDKWTYKDAVSVVYNYWYGWSYVRKFVIKELETMMEVYTYKQAGELSLSNCKEFREQNKTLPICKLSESKLIKLLKDTDLVSDEYVFYVLNKVRALNDKRSSIHTFMLLLKVNNKEISE